MYVLNVGQGYDSHFGRAYVRLTLGLAQVAGSICIVVVSADYYKLYKHMSLFGAAEDPEFQSCVKEESLKIYKHLWYEIFGVEEISIVYQALPCREIVTFIGRFQCFKEEQ